MARLFGQTWQVIVKLANIISTLEEPQYGSNLACRRRVVVVTVMSMFSLTSRKDGQRGNYITVSSIYIHSREAIRILTHVVTR